MGRSDQSVSPIRHADQVYSIANEDATAPHADEVSASWKRCLKNYHVDPATAESPRILTPYELKDQRAPLDRLIINAQEELPLTEIALHTGFSDHSHFARLFRRLTGMTPSEVRRGRH